jgi:PAS domain S-box-containing protein
MWPIQPMHDRMAYAAESVHPALDSRLRRYAVGTGIAVAGIGIAVLIGGWLLGIGAFKTVLPGQVSMKTNTAACFALTGISMSMLARGRLGARASWVARAFAIAATAVGAVTLFEYLLGMNLGIDQLIVHDVAEPVRSYSPGRMGPQTAVEFVMLGVALLAIDLQPRRGFWPSGVIAVIAMVVPLLALFGYVYGVSALYAVTPFSAMALHTAVGLIFLSVGLTCARPDRGVVALLTSDTTAGTIARSLLPPALLIPLMLGAAILTGQRHGMLTDAEAVWLLVSSTVLICASFAVTVAYSLSKADEGRRHAQQQLRAAERWYRTMVEQLPLAVYVDELNDSSSAVYMSPQMETMLGYPVQQWIDDRELFPKVIHPEDREGVLAEVAHSNRTGELFSAEYRMLARDGSVVWVHDEAVRVSATETRSEGYAQGYLLDITQRKAAEEERQQLAAKLNQAKRLESIGELAGGIAHDFNNLLGAITSYTEFIAVRATGDPALEKDVDRIRQAAEHGARLTRQLLLFGKRGVTRFELLDLNECVQQALRLLEPVAGEGVTLRTELAPDLWSVKADRSRVDQVLFNLVLNAQAAMPEGGTIEIRTANADSSEEPSMISDGKGDLVCLSVGDTGTGMTADVRDRAFDPFFTTKPKGEGTGLGLATVYGIVSKAGGDVVLTSEPGAGTTVKVFLPAHPEAAPAEAGTARPRGRGETVLVVDDNEDIRVSTARILQRAGYSTLEAASGVEARRLLEKTPDGVDLLLTDVVMPGMSGPELGSYTANRTPDTSVLYMSGYAESAECLGEAPLLEKPFEADGLLAAVASSLGVEVGA